MSLNKNFFMKSTIRFILVFLIINLTFVREGAALESGDFATPLWVQNLLVNTEETRPRGLTFSNDGTKMFVIGEQHGNGGTSGSAEDDIHEYTLSTAFDISTASYVDSLANLGDAFETSIKFNNDGSKMFVTGINRDYVQEYSLTANFDLSSATFESFFSVNSVEDNLFGLDFNNDGSISIDDIYNVLYTVENNKPIGYVPLGFVPYFFEVFPVTPCYLLHLSLLLV